MTKVLLTGASGFVGRQILRELRCHNCDIRVVLRSNGNDLATFNYEIERKIDTKNLFRESEQWWAEQCKDVDLIIHAAWYAEPGKYLYSELNTECLLGTLVMAKGAVLAGVKKFVGIGSCSEYDLSQRVLSVQSRLNPSNPYASSKVALFHGLNALFTVHSTSFAWCRLFYLFGEGEDQRRLIPYLRNRLQRGEYAELTSGNQIRDYMDVRDAGARIAKIALSGKTGPFNVCSGIPVTVRSLAESIAREYSANHLLRFGVRPDNAFDPDCVLGIPNDQ